MVTRRYASAGTRYSRRNYYQAHGHGYLGERTQHVTCDSAQPAHGMAGQREGNGKPCDDASGSGQLSDGAANSQPAERGHAQYGGGDERGYRRRQRSSDEYAKPSWPGGRATRRHAQVIANRPATVAATRAAAPRPAAAMLPTAPAEPTAPIAPVAPRDCAWASAAI